jgi:hypothetical protein
MLGGVRGAKHCLLPEANELIINRVSPDGALDYMIMPGQTFDDILHLLGYHGPVTKGQRSFP